MFSYKPLLKLLLDKEMSKTELRIKTGMSMATLAKIGKNENISMKTLDDICRVLDCRIEDVIEYVPDKNMWLHPSQKNNIIKKMHAYLIKGKFSTINYNNTY